ncbi:MAG TPA: hypothetical protein VEA60_14305 [Allosphingosinicella sp.]|nr:hypothetical protein [Allosphingosinicella sp.]
MRKSETWLSAMLLAATALLLPIAAFEPVSLAAAETRRPAVLLGACADGSAHLAMGCASISL